MKFLFIYNWATQREPTAVIPKLQDIPACVSFFLLSWYLFCSLLVSGIIIQYKIHPARVFFLKFVNSTNLLVRNLYIAKHTVSLLWKLPIKHNHTHAAIILFPLQEEPMFQFFVCFFLSSSMTQVIFCFLCSINDFYILFSYQVLSEAFFIFCVWLYTA